MRLARFIFLAAAACVLLGISTPEVAMAAANPVVTLIVRHNPAAGEFGTIGAAIIQINANRQDPLHTGDRFIIEVQADNGNPYVESFSPVSNIQIKGTSTANTFLNSAGTTISLAGLHDVTISNFTFQSATVAISISGGNAIDIRSNVFHLGQSGTAVQIQDANTINTSIINNTFVSNKTAISTSSNVVITNDIFYGNGTAITGSAVTLSYSYFFANGSNGVSDLGLNSVPNPQAGRPNADPLFVDPASDFHLRPNSPAVGSGNPSYPNSFNTSTSDMGAYGGPFSDNILAPIGDLSSSLSTPSTMALSWSTSANPKVTAYRVYYDTVSRFSKSPPSYSGAQATEGPSGFKVSTNSATLSNLPTTPPTTPAAPQLTSVTSLNQSLQLTWTAVPGATGYRIFYSTTADTANLPANPTTRDVAASVTTATLTGLTNGTPYFVTVAALAELRFFAAVTAVIDGTLPSSPGSGNESTFSNETNQVLAAAAPSPQSNVVKEAPAPIAPVPNLKGEGCFIATAAFGFYSAPQVQVLRDFRDRFLLTNAPGRAFVAWYYHYGPKGAHFINVHPWLKAPVRLALLPLVVGSFLLLHVPLPAKIAIMMLAIAFSALSRRRNARRLLVHSGGMR